MTRRIDLNEHENIQLTDADIRTESPDRLGFAIEGMLTVGPALLAEFEGTTLNPVRVTVSAADPDSIPIDLTGPPSLHLENVDVGVATPSEDDIADELDAFRPSTDDEPSSIDAPEVIAFTAEGTIRDVPTETLEAIADADGTPELESITFAVDGTQLSDGGAEDDDVVFELSLLGYWIVVRRDGTIVVGSDGDLACVELP